MPGPFGIFLPTSARYHLGGFLPTSARSYFLIDSLLNDVILKVGKKSARSHPWRSVKKCPVPQAVFYRPVAGPTPGGFLTDQCPDTPSPPLQSSLRPTPYPSPPPHSPKNTPPATYKKNIPLTAKNTTHFPPTKKRSARNPRHSANATHHEQLRKNIEDVEKR